MRHAWILLFLPAASAALGQQDDEAALALADRAEAQPTAQRACLEYAEAAATETTFSDATASSAGGRTSFAIRCDESLAPTWRGVFSDRVDYFFEHGASAQLTNTLKEAYLSWREGGVELVDFGRVNVREGVGFAYNPTDYFRANAVRAVISIDPNTLRDERLGTLMVRSQTLWSSGSLTAIFAPRVNAEPNDSSFSPDFGATNAQSRWVVILSQHLAEGLQPQLSLTGAQHQSPQAGLDLTYLVNRATVAYLEWSGGRSVSNLTASGYGAPVENGSGFHSRLSTGLTYTTPFKLSMTLEYEYDGAAPDSNEWAFVRYGPLAPYVTYREYAAGEGELATRQNVFAYAHWDDVLIPHLGLTAFVRYDPFDHSHVTWSEARYYWSHVDVAVQWQRNAGDATSDLAPWPKRQSWLALVGYYF